MKILNFKLILAISFIIGSFQLNAATSTVYPGNSIQSAIDYVAANGGGTVYLKAGTHKTNSTIYMKSNVTIEGDGMGNTTIEAQGNFDVIRQNAEGQSNMEFRDFKIKGKNHADCYGIKIEALSSWHNNVWMRNVEVRNCGMGVHFKRVHNVWLEDCYIQKNGAAGKEKYFHNLYIRSCDGLIRIKNCRLNNSTTGNGLNISFCENVIVSDTEARYNYFRGMRAADTDGFEVSGCTITNNGNVGLLANQEGGMVTKNINWYNNTVKNNSKEGIQAKSGATGYCYSNISTGNGYANYDLPSTVNAWDLKGASQAEYFNGFVDDGGSIFPNPMVNDLNVLDQKGSRIKIYNSIGTLVYSSEIKDNLQTLDLNKLTSGMYIVKLQKDGEGKSYKLLKK